MINWIIRYAKILDQNRELFDPSHSILEVGSGTQGIAQYLKRKVTGLEPAFHGPVNEWLEPAEGSIFEIPFADASFDTVICVDVLEHLAAEQRGRAIAELARCARAKVIISCPCGIAAIVGETQLRDFFNKYFIAIPPWLTEHFANGLPTVGAILGEIANTGLRFEVTGNETITQHYAGLLLDYVFPFAAGMKTDLLAKTSLMAPLSGAEWDHFYSFLFTLHLGTQTRPALNLDYKAASTASSHAEIYCIQHTAWPTSHLGRVTPIFAGASANTAPPGAITDLPFNEPPLLNTRWSELSAIYKIWRDGPRSDIVGFCHYRRLFDFSKPQSSPRETPITQEQLPAHTQAYFNQARLDALGGGILCAMPLAYDQTVWEMFIRVHNTQDYCRLTSIVSALCPQLIPFLLQQHHDHVLYANNMFVANWIYFDELCSLWFGILREFERQVPTGRGNDYQNRDISFLSERIFDAWIRYKKSLGITITEIPIFFVQDE